MAGGVLRYSDRVELLRSAGQLGIARFHANLIIAAVQHGTVLHPVIQGNRTSRATFVLTILAFGLVQSVICIAVWSIWFR